MWTLRSALVPITAPLLLAVLATSSGAQWEFDFISYDRITVDPAAALGFGTSWGILVNTGTTPIPMAEWDQYGQGLTWGQSSVPLSVPFHVLQLSPGGSVVMLNPGEAVGLDDPLLLAQLGPGETFVHRGSVGNLSLTAPYPAGGFGMRLAFQLGDRVATTGTRVSLGTLGGPAFVGTSARRVSAVPTNAMALKFGEGCTDPLIPRLGPDGLNPGAGPPYLASGTNMPVLGNHAFGLELDAPEPLTPCVFALDVATAEFVYKGCEIRLALTPALILIPGFVDEFFDARLQLPISPDPSLLGAHLYAQGSVFTLGPPNGQFTTSNALEIEIGAAP